MTPYLTDHPALRVVIDGRTCRPLTVFSVSSVAIDDLLLIPNDYLSASLVLHMSRTQLTVWMTHQVLIWMDAPQ